MTREEIQKAIDAIILQIKVLQLQLQKMLGQKVTIPGQTNPTMVVVHHGAGDLDFKGVDYWHKLKWGFKSSLGFYIGYQKFIEFDGSLHVGRRDTEEGAHTKGFNKSSIGICLQGNMEEMEPTASQLKTLKGELDYYKAIGMQIRMHRQFVATLCPGKNLDKWILANYT